MSTTQERLALVSRDIGLILGIPESELRTLRLDLPHWHERDGDIPGPERVGSSVFMTLKPDQMRALAGLLLSHGLVLHEVLWRTDQYRRMDDTRTWRQFRRVYFRVDDLIHTMRRLLEA